MSAPRRQRETVRPYFAGVVIENAPSSTLADAQRLVTERLVRHVAREQVPTHPASGGEEAAD